MKQRMSVRKLLRKTRSPLRRGIIAAGVAMIVFPEPITTAIGTIMVGACLAAPERRRSMRLVHCGASIRRGHLSNYGHSYA
jgi:hypothetical protein